MRLALAQQRAGIEPTGETIVPGVLTWEAYLKRRATWDIKRQTVGLDAEFYEGAEVRLYPPDWLARANLIAEKWRLQRRIAKAMGIDPAEGGDSSVWTIIDEFGIIEQLSIKTPDTSVIPNTTLALMNRWSVPSSAIVFDRGGGGYEHMCTLHSRGYPDIRSIAFGESLNLDPKRGMTKIEDKLEMKHERTIFKNRRAEMYWDLRKLLDPIGPGFGIPKEYEELLRQLKPIPLWYNEEGMLYLPPKQRKPDQKKESTQVTMNSLLGCSPDEADSLVLAIHGMLYKKSGTFAGAI